MRTWSGKRYWIVGASEGLGRALALKMSQAGGSLILSARNRDRLDDLAASMPGSAQVVPVDVADTASVESAAAEVGPVDGLVYLSAVYWPMKAQDWNAEHVEAMCNINFTGAARVAGAVIPGMIARGSGHIVLTGSLSGFRGLPGAIGYGASKAAAMHLAETMHMDLKRTGIDVQLVNPGFIRTRLTDMNDFRMPFIMDADEAARRYFAHMATDRFAANFPRGFAAMFRLSQFLPDWLYYRLF